MEASPSARPAPVRAEAPSPLAALGLAVAFSLCFYMMFPPVDFDLLSLMVLVPLLLLVEWEPSRGRLFRWGWFTGWLAFSACFVWIRHVAWVAVGLTGAVCGFYVALYAVLQRSVAARPSLAGWAFCMTAWTGCEYLRGTTFLGGIPWFLLGHTQYKVVELIQVSDVTGAYGLSFVLAGVSYLMYWLTSAWLTGGNAARARGFQAACAIQAVLAVAVAVYGFAVTKPPYPPDGPRIAVVQANIPQDLKEEALLEWGRVRGVLPEMEIPEEDKSGAMLRVIREIFDTHRRMTLGIKEDFDMVVWPETMSPYPIGEYADNAFVLADLAKGLDRDFLVGVLTAIPQGQGRYRTSNSAYLFDRSGTARGRYDKMHLVPIGEYVPGLHWIPGLEGVVLTLSALQSVPDLIPGDRMTIFPSEQKPFGVLICFDVIFPNLYAEWCRRGAVYLVTLSNDGWFRDGAELEQTLIMSQFGCASCKTGMVRAMNTGISSFIDPYGRAEVLSGEAGKTKEIAGTLVRRVHQRLGSTLYMQIGDLFAQVCAALAVGVGLAAWVRSRRLQENVPTGS